MDYVTLLPSDHGLERRLQPAPAAREARGTTSATLLHTTTPSELPRSSSAEARSPNHAEPFPFPVFRTKSVSVKKSCQLCVEWASPRELEAQAPRSPERNGHGGFGLAERS